MTTRFFSLMALAFIITTATPEARADDGTYLYLGATNMSLSGDQATGSGTGFTFKTKSVRRESPKQSFDGGMGVEIKSARVDNSGDKCCFAKDKAINISAFGINAQLLWPVGPVGLGFEVGVYSLDLRQDLDDPIVSNFGTTKFAAVASSKVANDWAVDLLYEYFMPMKEEAGGESHDLRVTSVSLALGYRLPYRE